MNGKYHYRTNVTNLGAVVHGAWQTPHHAWNPLESRDGGRYFFTLKGSVLLPRTPISG